MSALLEVSWAGAPSGFIEGTTATINGQASYRILIQGQPDYIYPVIGGLVSLRITYAGQDANLPGPYTDTVGRFDIPLDVPGEAGDQFDVEITVYGGTSAGAVGGIGTRGTGEKQLEIDRRLVGKRITELKRQLAGIDKRKLREISGRSGHFKICLVGYTNSGKSTLMNALTGAGVFVEDKLFATLDTRTRKWAVGGGAEVLLSDTVGFVKRLPHQLVASFKATLEEAVNADLLLHVVDASNAEVFEQITSVDTVLEEIGCGGKEKLMLLNKVDVLSKASLLESLQTVYPQAICISAKTGMNLDQLGEVVLVKFRGGQVLVQVNCSAGNGKVLSFLQANAKILEREYLDSSVTIKARLGKNQLPLLKRLNPKDLEVIENY